VLTRILRTKQCANGKYSPIPERQLSGERFPASAESTLRIPLDQLHVDAKDIADGTLMLAGGLDIDGMDNIDLIAFDSE
jgi:hypothetical protein